MSWRRQLRRARQCMDQGTVDSLRLETVCAGRVQPNATEWFVRCWAPESAASADQRCAAVAQSLDARDARGWVESAAGRRGDLPDHDERYSLPPGTHHARTGREGFLGIEVNVNWGDQLDSALRVVRGSLRGSRNPGAGAPAGWESIPARMLSRSVFRPCCPVVKQLRTWCAEHWPSSWSP